MGKTHQALTILVATQWLTDERIEALRAKGHKIVSFADDLASDEVDIILHPGAHGWGDDMWPMLDVTLKAGRARRYPKKEKA